MSLDRFDIGALRGSLGDDGALARSDQHRLVDDVAERAVRVRAQGSHVDGHVVGADLEALADEHGGVSEEAVRHAHVPLVTRQIDGVPAQAHLAAALASDFDKQRILWSGQGHQHLSAFHLEVGGETRLGHWAGDGWDLLNGPKAASRQA